MSGWMLFDAESANAIDATDDPLVAGKWWRESLTDKALFLDPDIDCEGDCCPYKECRFGLSGGPSCATPEDL